MKKVVISLGGSIIVPDEVNHAYLKKFCSIIQKQKDTKFIIVTGGGKIARNYISAVQKGGLDRRSQNLVGIMATRLNAMLVATFLGMKNWYILHTVKGVIDRLKRQRIVVCGGILPGTTSDGTALQLAVSAKADMFINITNVKGLFTKHPKLKGAEFIPKISHKDMYKRAMQMKYKPGQHFVIDQKAAKIAYKHKVPVVILKGLDNLERCLKGKSFTGTIVTD
jgi:uridylate kinase